MSSEEAVPPVKSLAPRKFTDTYSNEPPFWFALGVWFFPVWWLICYISSLSAITRIATQFGFDLPSLLSPQGLCAPFILIPVLWGALLLKTNNWFRRRLPIMIIVWIALIVLGDVTQGAMSEAFWLAQGCPVKDSLEVTERRAPGRYLPNRCHEYMNSRASGMLEAMNERVICEEPNPKFVCRLLVLGSDTGGSVKCFRIETQADGSGILCYKKIDSEPNPYSKIRFKFGRDTMLSREYRLSTTKLKELDAILAGAEQYYQRYKYRSDRFASSGKHYLLEFQVLGKYFYYDVPERSSARVPLGTVQPEPMPPFLQKLLTLCQDTANVR